MQLRVDRTALRFNQASIIALLLIAFLLDSSVAGCVRGRRHAGRFGVAQCFALQGRVCTRAQAAWSPAS